MTVQPTSLVTGGAGFLGSHVVDELIRMGHRVIVLDDLSGGCLDNVSVRAICAKGDVSDPVVVRSLFSYHKPDYVFHLAAYAAEGLSHHIRRYNYTNNVIGSATIINESIRQNVKCLVFTSSIAVYGEPAQLPVTESTPRNPIDPYGIAKLTIEYDLAAARRYFGLNSIVFRPHNVYGERQNIHDPYRNVVGIFVRQALNGQPLTVFGDGSQTRAFSYIDDVAPIIARCIDRTDLYNQTFNIGADEPVSVADLAAAVMEVVHSRVPIQYLDARDEAAHVYADHRAVKDAFGIDTETPLATGLARTVRWARGLHNNKPSSRELQLELRRGLPAAWIKGG